MEGKFIIASGPVIVRNKRLLLSRDNKDDFYKLIGGGVKEGERGRMVGIMILKMRGNKIIYLNEYWNSKRLK